MTEKTWYFGNDYGRDFYRVFDEKHVTIASVSDKDDARLIAASPRLLEANKETLELMNLMEGHWPGTMSIYVRKLKEAIVAAIELAEPSDPH